MAFIAQMFLSKGNDLSILKALFYETDARNRPQNFNSYDFSSVAFMSGAALLLAKIALLFSALVNTFNRFLTHNPLLHVNSVISSRFANILFSLERIILSR